MKQSSIKKMQITICIFFTSFFCKAQQSFDTLVDLNNYVEFPYSIYQVQDSGYVFITSGDSANTYYIEFNKLDKDGTIGFQKKFGFPGVQCYVGMSNSLKRTIDGGWVFSGGMADASLNESKGMLVKYDNIGDTEFVKIISDTVWQTFYDCIQTSDSNFVLVGDKNIPNHLSDFWIVKTDVNGNVLWERTLGTNLDEQSFHVIENAQHQLVISGAKENSSLVHYPYAAVYDLQGNLITTKSFNQGALLSGGGYLALWRE